MTSSIRRDVPPCTACRGAFRVGEKRLGHSHEEFDVKTRSIVKKTHAIFHEGCWKERRDASFAANKDWTCPECQEVLERAPEHHLSVMMRAIRRDSHDATTIAEMFADFRFKCRERGCLPSSVLADALHQAAKTGSVPVVKELLKFPIHPEVPSHEIGNALQTALNLAQEAGHEAVIEELKASALYAYIETGA